MFRMEIDSPPTDDVEPDSPQDCITQRLETQGVPTEYLKKLQPGLVAYYKKNRPKLPGIVSAILPTDEANVVDVIYFQESMVWLQWLMFEKDPIPVLKNLVELSDGQRGVCGAVWGNNDIAYRCRTCEHDPTCAICVPCFQNGNHKDHDYSIIYTGGGCCDCGDVTAWKSNGFCSKHKGAEQIQHLSEELANSIEPVLDLLFSFWKYSLSAAENLYLRSHRVDNRVDEKKISDGLATAIVEMLLEFCNCSESLLSFISARVLSSVGLLNILVRAERFLHDEDVTKLQGLLLKMLSEPLFKYEFAKVFLNYYPSVVSEAIKRFDDDVYKKYPLLSTFSVQIFTVPTLTPRLVKEKDLLVILLKCLGNIFVSCAGKDGRLEVSKWLKLYDTTLRVVEDVRFVMSHAVIPKYVTHDRRDIVKMWMKILAFMQGMNPHRRETGTHIEEEYDIVHFSFYLGLTVANIHSLLVAGVFSEGSVDEKDDENLFNYCKSYYDDQDIPRHAKVGRHSEESSVSSRNNILGSRSGVAIIKSDIFLSQSAVSRLTNECLKAIESWLTLPTTANMLGNNFFELKKMSNTSKLASTSELQGTRHSLSVQNEDIGSPVGIDMELERVIEQGAGSGGLEENAMETEKATEIEALRVLRLSDWPEISYDVSSMDVSVHIPLLRFLSMILQRAAKKCYGELSSPKTVNFSSLDASSAVPHDFFGNVLSGFHPHGFSAFIMEHPLRIRVFCAQVHAGMWKKNGEVAILSWTLYRSANWSEQGLELDLFLLQCCAALAPADLYVSRLLERFGLSNYLFLDIQRFNEFEPVLMQEMLILIIQVIKERRFCGLSTTACLQRELIRKLAIGNATRSQLVKSLPRDLSKNDRLQEILDKVAVYSNPSGMEQGMYKLRLEFWKQLDLYHPRWDLRDLQIAEERYLHFCQASLLSSQLPKWTNIYQPFIGIARIATCKMVLQIIGSVLFYSVKTNNSVPSLAPDSLLLTALHLLSLALDICSQERESSNLSGSVGNSFPILAFAGEDLFVSHSNESCDESLLSLLVASMRMHKRERPENLSEAGNFNISSLIQSSLKKMAELDSGCMTKMHKLAPEVVSHLSHSSVNSGLVTEADKRKAKARAKQAAIMEKMRAQQSKFLESVISSAKDESEDSKGGEASTFDVGIVTEESTQDVCSLCHDSKSNSPRCFLILLQKSMLQSLVDRDPPSWKDISCSDKENFLEMSPLPDKKISTSNSGQNSPQFNQLIQSAINEFASDGHPRELNAFVEFIKYRFPSVRNILLPSTSSKACEKTAASLETLEEQVYLTTCEQMRLNLELEHKFPMVNESPESKVDDSILLGKYIATLSKETFENTLPLESPRTRTELLESSKAFSGLAPVDCDGVHVSSCGHAVHQACLDRYLLSVKKRYFTHAAIEERHTADPDQGEFLCPVCRGIANSVLPALPRNSTMIGSASTSCSTSDNKEFGKLFLREAFSLLSSAADVVGRNEILKVFPTDQIGRISPNLESVFRVLSGMYFPENQDKALGSERVSHSMIMWDTLKYSLISTEIASRCQSSSLSPNFTIDALFTELKSSKGFILSLLLKIVLSTRNKNSLNVLLRWRGIQLFAESVCSGTSVDDFATHSLKQGGNMSSILKKLGREVPYPDIEFWKRASNPILSSEAFSSLMWLLFCLPSQIISCTEFFKSLVHLFYGVSVVQAVITYFGKYQYKMSELGCDGALITEIFNIMQECGVAKNYFILNHSDHSFDIKSIIRALSFPFLRRCGLLWKVINASTFAPFGDEARLWDNSPFHANDMIEDVNSNIVDVAQVEALEKMFNIPPLDLVLRDEVLCSLGSKWLRHFNKEFEARYAQTVLPMTPVVPFKLMQLPNVYHDLLQRYIKKHCPSCNSAMNEPALCLLCGKLCTPNWKPCCSKSDCQKHVMACGAGIGVFLLVRRTTILLHRVARMGFWPSPYLDAFGEEDLDMQRGKPLYLNEERYAFLAYVVASHEFDRISKQSRQITLVA